MQSGPTTRKNHIPGYGAVALASCIWGTGFYFGRLALNEMGVEHMVLYRFAFATLAMLPILLRRWRELRLTASEFRTLLISATLGIPVQFLIQFHGLARTTVSHAALMVGTLPVLLALTATLFGGERLDRIGWGLLWLSTLGAAMVTLGGTHGKAAQGEPTLLGDLLVVFSLLTSLVWIMLNKKLMQRHSPEVVSALTILCGSLLLAAWVLGPWLLRLQAAPPPFAQLSRTAWLALAASGILCSGATTLLWNWGIHHVPASRAGVFLNIEPAMGSFLGVELLGEHLGPFAWIGGLLILGAALALTARSHSPEPEIILE
jgi:drug/metabolite transporter (DMT)-like permease